MEATLHYVSPAGDPASRAVRTESGLLASDEEVCRVTVELPSGWELNDDESKHADAWNANGIALVFRAIAYKGKDMPRTIYARPADSGCPIGPVSLKIVSREWADS